MMEWMLAVTLGALAGAVFFGGLWLTLRGIGASPRPGLRALASLLGRLTVVAAATLLVIRLHPPAAAAFLAGFLAVRAAARRRWAPAAGPADGS